MVHASKGQLIHCLLAGHPGLPEHVTNLLEVCVYYLYNTRQPLPASCTERADSERLAPCLVNLLV